MNKSKRNKLEKIVKAIRALIPGGNVSLALSRSGEIEVTNWEPKTYKAATDWFREWEMGIRSKLPHHDSTLGSYTRLSATEAKITLHAFPDELPPTCRKVEYVERIPKVQTTETGEFINIKREKIVCGDEEL